MQGHLSMIIQPDISPVLCLSVTVNDDIFKLTWMKLNLGHDWLVWFILIDSIHVTVRAGRALVCRAGSARPARLEKKGENTSSPRDHKTALEANRPSRRRSSCRLVTTFVLAARRFFTSKRFFVAMPRSTRWPHSTRIILSIRLSEPGWDWRKAIYCHHRCQPRWDGCVSEDCCRAVPMFVMFAIHFFD